MSLAVLVCVLVLVVALGSNRSAVLVSGSTSYLVVVAICLIAVAVLIYSLRAGRRRRPGNEQFRQRSRAPLSRKLVNLVIAVALIGGLLGVILLMRRESHGILPPETTTTRVRLGTTTTGLKPVINSSVNWWVIVILAAVVVGAVVLLVMSQRRRKSAEEEEDLSGPNAQMLAAVEYSLEEIQRETDPRRAVIRAYVRMGQILAGHGLGRLPYEAPTEYLNRSVAGIQLSRGAAERLTDLYVRARFSPHVVDPKLKQDAITALTAVRDELQAMPQ